MCDSPRRPCRTHGALSANLGPPLIALTRQAAEPAREVLEKHGIDINHEANGAGMKTEAHQTTHTSDYYRDTNQRITEAGQQGKEAVLDTLRDIGKKLEER